MNENQVIETEKQDFSDLQTSLESLVEVLEEEQKLKEEQATKLAEEEQKIQESEKVAEEQQMQVMTLQESQTATLDDIKLEMQTLNTNIIALTEKTEKQNELVVETSITMVMALVITIAVKVLVDQITKW